LINAIGNVIIPLLGLLMLAYLGVAAWFIYKPEPPPPVHRTADEVKQARSGRRPARSDAR